MDDIFNKEEFLKGEDITGLIPEDHIVFYEQIDSTNAELLRRLSLSKGALRDEKGSLTEEGLRYHKMMATASSQTAGRGRLGRAFYSPNRSGIYFSYIYVPEGGVADPAFFTIASAVGVARAIDVLFKCRADLKWVNDIYISGKKVSGILAEGYINPDVAKLEALVTGIGINISFKEDVPEDLARKAGGVSDITGVTDVSRVCFLKECLKNIMNILDSKEDVMEEYRSRSMLTGRTVTVSPVINQKDKDYIAEVMDIDHKGRLVVKKHDGSIESLNYGEVTLHYN